MTDFEKLGAFYLGREYDLRASELKDDLLLYDAKDLTTHAVCVGMTGSGKTGLCVSLLEEAAIDGIPSIVIDPKGDLGNLLLTFPELKPGDFEPWIDEGEAARKGMSVPDYAKEVSTTWREGLSSWGQDGERISRLRAAADVAIYTPGSNAGLPLSVLRSLAAPAGELLDDSDAMRERVLAVVSGLLALLGIDADPIRSREHILLSTIIDGAWRAGRDLGLAGLIREIQTPPFDRVGVFDLESFYSSKERAELAMTLNNLLASPGFAAWMEGERLVVPRLLWTDEGRPRISILSIAHLPEPERMFFVTILLNEVVAWMRTQPGSTSLRALLYMDEVFGYFPPTANPPSKTPMLTLLKQARAFGLGVVLATQNPVDLDYKGLSNAGTWFLGRLQTERDKARVLDGLEGVAAGGGDFDRKRISEVLAGLKSRVFLMNNVHDDEPAIFHTRWAMSYLRGPLTRTQIKRLMDHRRLAAPTTMKGPAVATPPAASTGAAGRPVVPAGIEESFLPVSRPLSSNHALAYRPALLGTAQLHFANARYKVDEWRRMTLLLPLIDDEISADPWSDAEQSEINLKNLESDPAEGARFGDLPSAAINPKTIKRWQKSLGSYLYREHALTLWRCDALKQTSKPGETEGEFRSRLSQLAREARDLKLDKLRKRHAPKLARLKKRIQTAEVRVDREQSQYKSQKLQTAISWGATALGSLLGRKAVSMSSVGRATTAMRGMGRAAREKQDVGRAEDSLERLRAEFEQMDAQFREELAELQDRDLGESLELEPREVKPRKSDISVDDLQIVWTPWRIDRTGIAEPVFE